MESKIYSTSENCGSQLCYQLFVFDERDDHACTDVYTWIGEDDEDIFSLALEKMLIMITETTGQTITKDMYEHYGRLVKNNTLISRKGYRYVLNKCEICTII